MSLGQQLAGRLMLPVAGLAPQREDVEEADGVELIPALVSQAPRFKKAGASNRFPMVSVVLATRNRARLLPEALAALSGQTYPPDRYELVAIDDDSTDGTPGILEAFAAEAGFCVRIEHTHGIGDIAARNAGAGLARGDIIAFTDDDCRVPAGWLEAGAQGFQRNVGFVAGPIFAKPEQQISFLSFVTQQLQDTGLYAASNVFYRRELFLAEDGFSERRDRQGRPAWGWDTTAAWRLLRKGYQVRFRPEAYSYHHVHHPGLRRWLFMGWHAQMVPAMLRDIPELRRSFLDCRLFYSRESAMFELGLLGTGTAIGRRKWRWLLLWLPWLRVALDLTRGDWWPPYRWIKLPVKVGLLFLQHLILVAGLVRGTARSRRLVL
jgi:glycosyltransferase involved in cell wall biosynthesis